jgi:hypothetical protein
LGRWISRDPIGTAGGLNLYGYAGDDPVNRNDPLGLATIGLGISGSFQLGPINFNVFAGVVIDTNGNYGTYYGLGAGLGEGGKASGGVSVSASNATSICDLREAFYNLNVGGGADLDAEVNGYHGNSPDGPVTGGGVTIGAGLGAGGSVGKTYTWVNPTGTI